MYCDRYKKDVEEAIYFNCDVPSKSKTFDELVEECKTCTFCRKGKDDEKIIN